MHFQRSNLNATVELVSDGALTNEGKSFIESFIRDNLHHKRCHLWFFVKDQVKVGMIGGMIVCSLYCVLAGFQPIWTAALIGVIVCAVTLIWSVFRHNRAYQRDLETFEALRLITNRVKQDETGMANGSV